MTIRFVKIQSPLGSSALDDSAHIFPRFSQEQKFPAMTDTIAVTWYVVGIDFQSIFRWFLLKILMDETMGNRDMRASQLK